MNAKTVKLLRDYAAFRMPPDKVNHFERRKLFKTLKANLNKLFTLDEIKKEMEAECTTK